MACNAMTHAFDTSPFVRDCEVDVPMVSPREHWSGTVQAFARSGGLVTGDELAELLRSRFESGEDVISWAQPVSIVARWIVSRSVVSIKSPWGLALPLFQFDLPRAIVHPCMRPLLCELKGAFDDTELAMWFVTDNDWLDGSCPADLMHTDLNAVRQAARSDRFVAVGF